VSIFLLGVFFFFLADYIFTPFLALYVTMLGGDYTLFGLITSISAIVASFLQSFVGFLNDKSGSKKILLIGIFVSSISFLLMFLSTHKWLLLLYNIMLGVGLGIVVPSLFSFISKLKTSKGESFIPYYRTFQSSAVIIAPIIGGYISEISLRINAFLAFVLTAVSMVVLLIYYRKFNVDAPKIDEDIKTDDYKYLSTLKEIFNTRAFFMICFLFTLLELDFDAISLNIPIIGAETNTKQSLIGYGISAYFITYTLFQIPVYKFLKKFREQTVVLALGLLSLASGVPLILNVNFIFTIISMALQGIFIGNLFTYCTILASNYAPVEKRGAYLGVFNTIMPLTDVISPIIVVTLLKYNNRLPFVFSSLMMVIFVFIAYRQFSSKHSDIAL
jgi:MFS family permease